MEEFSAALSLWGPRARLAEALHVSVGMVDHWCSGRKAVSTKRAIEIESATGRRVMRWHCRPNDWHVYWPELKRHKRAPKIVSAA